MKLSSLWRIRSRGLSGTAKLSTYYALRYLQYSTPRKITNLCITKASKALRRPRLASMPYRFTIDPGNLCNLRCPLCPTGLGILARPQRFMKLDAFKRVIDEIAPWTYLVDMYNWGEPFLQPDIFEMIRYAHERRIFTRLSSNLNHYNPSLAARTVEAGLDAIYVSIDGATEESYQRYRRRGKLATVLQNVAHLAEAKRTAGANHPLISGRFLINRYNEGEIEAARRLMLDSGADTFNTAPLFVDTTDPAQREEWLPSDSANSTYEYDDRNQADDIHNVWHCSDLWEMMVINPDGGVAPCCWLHHAEGDFANAFELPLRTIWNGDAYVSARLTFARGGAQAGPRSVICNKCRGRPLYLKE